MLCPDGQRTNRVHIEAIQIRARPSLRQAAPPRLATGARPPGRASPPSWWAGFGWMPSMIVALQIWPFGPVVACHLRLV